MTASANLRQSVCLVVCDANYKVLMVSRANGSGVCLPGGKREEGETLTQTACRELWEETGLRTREQFLVPIYQGVCTGSGHDEAFDVASFLVTQWEGEAEQKEARVVPQWLAFPTLFCNSPFAVYNKQMANKLMEKFPYFAPHIKD